MRRAARLAVLAAVVAATTAALFLNGLLRLNYPSRARFPVRGIDVSHHQGPIDWERVRRDDVAFAFIKATEGRDVRDRRFAANWDAAAAANIERGAYHFFTFCTPGVPQAENFIAAVTPRQRMLPPVVDVEFSGNCASPPPDEAIRAELAVFLARLEAAYDRVPIIYTTTDAYTRIVAWHFPDHPIWARNILCEAALDDGRTWTFWQFADRGRVAGVDTLVDLNVFRGTAEAFQSCAAARRCL